MCLLVAQQFEHDEGLVRRRPRVAGANFLQANPARELRGGGEDRPLSEAKAARRERSVAPPAGIRNRRSALAAGRHTGCVSNRRRPTRIAHRKVESKRKHKGGNQLQESTLRRSASEGFRHDLVAIPSLALRLSVGRAQFGLTVLCFCRKAKAPHVVARNLFRRRPCERCKRDQKKARMRGTEQVTCDAE